MLTVKMAAHVTRKRDEDRRMSGVESIRQYMIIRAYGLGASYISCHIDGM